MNSFGVAVVSCRKPFPVICQRVALGFLACSLWLFSARIVAAAEPDAGERDAFLRAIAQVETGGNPRAIGRQGERGMFQFNRTTWRLHTTRSFQEAHDPVVAFNVAIQHYEWLYDGFVRAGREPTPYLMASAWNAGLSRALAGRAPAVTRDYARRVVNIVVDSRRQAVPVVQPKIYIAAGDQ